MKNLLLCCLLLMNVGLFAQCPVSVTINATPDAFTTEVCKGDLVVLTAIPVNGGVNPTYVWIIDGDSSFTAGIDTTISAYNQSVQVIVQTTSGCTEDTVISNTIPQGIQTVNITESTNQLNYDCTLDIADIEITQTGGTDPITYELQGFPSNTTGSFSAVPSGSYNLFMTDDNGCKDTSVVVVVPEPPNYSSAGAAILECNQTVGDVFVVTTGGSPSFSYELVGVDVNTSGSFTDVPVGSYTLYTKDNTGCKDTAVVIVEPVDCPEPSPTDVITPNDDGENDMWLITNISYYPEKEVFIFDRWGQRVYHKKGYDNLDGWQAKYVGGNLAVSTYYYILKVTVEDGDDLVYKGAISVFR